MTAATAKRILLSSLTHLCKAPPPPPPQRCVARTAMRTLTATAASHSYDAALIASTSPPHLVVLPANHSTRVMSAARPHHNVMDNNPDDQADAKLYGWGVLTVLLGANALAIWCEFNDENSYLRSLATLRKAQAAERHDHEESDAASWRSQQQQRRRTKILHLTWPGTSTKQ